MFEERRKFFRLNINVNIKWKKFTGDGKKGGAGKVPSKNLSAGGVCITSYKRLSQGERLVLEIELPTGKTINAGTKVVWVNEFDTPGGSAEKMYEAGIEFIDITDRDREEIKEFCLASPGEK